MSTRPIASRSPSQTRIVRPPAATHRSKSWPR
jgi:hypothetical protein